MRMIRIIALSALLAAPSTVASAQTLENLPDELENALRQMMEDLQPALDEAMKLFKEFETNYDPRHYETPEILPNGDIIIRRRPDAPDYKPAPPETEPGETEPDGSIKT